MGGGRELVGVGLVGVERAQKDPAGMGADEHAIPPALLEALQNLLHAALCAGAPAHRTGEQTQIWGSRDEA